MEKQELRERVWDDLEDGGIARFPFPPHGRIPNFAGAEAAAERLGNTNRWQDATAIKANPDAPQLPVRRRALEEGKTVYMARPRLREERCFLELDPDDIEDLDAAATVSHMAEFGRPVGPDEVESIDLVVCGSVAVTPESARIGKGEGYSDLEFAVLVEVAAIAPEVPVVTTVHERQVLTADVPIEPHDVPLDLIATPDRVLEESGRGNRPEGIDWSLLSAGRIDELPVLAQFR